MTSSRRRSARTQATTPSYAEVPEEQEDSSGEAVLQPVTTRSLKRRRPVVIDPDDDDLDEETVLSPKSPARATRGRKHAKASASKVAAPAANRQALRGSTAASDVSEGEMPTVDDDDYDSDEFDAYVADNFDEDDTDDDEDEEFIPGPDVEGEEELDDDILSPEQDFQTATHNQPQELENDGVNGRFEQILRRCLEELVDWAKGVEFDAWRALPRAKRCMTFGSWRILSRTSVEFLMNMFSSAYPRDVQNLVASDTWTLDAILALPDTFGDKRQGIYGNFPTGGPSRPEIGCEAYVGSAQVLNERTYTNSKGHSAIARKYLPGSLPKKYRGSLHYNDICRPGVENNFRALCRFDVPVQPGYLHLLESVNMILFGTYNDRGRYHMFASEASYDMVRTVRSSLGLPEVAWGGLNAAWPLFQGIPARSIHKESPCANEACGMMTYPKKLRPENSRRTPRFLFDRFDPLGSYLCGSCGTYRMKHEGNLPDAEWRAKADAKWDKYWTPERIAQMLARKKFMAELRAENGPLKCTDCLTVEGAGVIRFQLFDDKPYCHTCYNRRHNNIEARDLIGQDIKCDGCGKHRSELPTFTKKNVKGIPVTYPGRMIRSKVLLGKTLCHPCHKFANRNGRLRTAAEIKNPSRGRGALKKKKK